MNNSKTYTISEDLYKAIIESAFIKGCISQNSDSEIGLRRTDRDKNMQETLQMALKTIEDQQYIYEN